MVVYPQAHTQYPHIVPSLQTWSFHLVAFLCLRIGESAHLANKRLLFICRVIILSSVAKRGSAGLVQSFTQACELDVTLRRGDRSKVCFSAFISYSVPTLYLFKILFFNVIFIWLKIKTL